MNRWLWRGVPGCLAWYYGRLVVGKGRRGGVQAGLPTPPHTKKNYPPSLAAFLPSLFKGLLVFRERSYPTLPPHTHRTDGAYFR